MRTSPLYATVILFRGSFSYTKRIMADSSCPTEQTLKDYVGGILAEGDADALSAHLSGCDTCQATVDELMRKRDSMFAKLKEKGPDEGGPQGEQAMQKMMADAVKLVGSPGSPGSGTKPSASKQKTPNRHVVDLEGFMDTLIQSKLIDEDEAQKLRTEISPTTTQEFAEALVAKEKLTTFQANSIAKGRWKGLVLGNYIVLEEIGKGGMGLVFKARHAKMGRIVGLKVLFPSGMRSPEIIERFQREAMTIGSLHHDNIVVAHDADEADGIHYLVMEYIDGSDLSKLVQSQGPLDVNTVIKIAHQTAQALAYAHGAGVVHRDVKPHNILLDREGNIKILDLGLARFDSYLGVATDASMHASMTSTGMVMGTVDYMSPEQALNSKYVDHRSDIYSLGCTVFYLLNAREIYEGETVVEKLVAHREQPIPCLATFRPEVTNEFDAIFSKMVAKHRDDRYNSMNDLVEDLESIMQGHAPIHAPLVPPQPSSASTVMAATPPPSAGMPSTIAPAPAMIAAAPDESESSADMAQLVPEAARALSGSRRMPGLQLALAASLILLISIGAIGFMILGGNDEPTPDVALNNNGNGDTPSPFIEEPDTGPGPVEPIVEPEPPYPPRRQPPHPNTLAKGGKGRILVAIGHQGFNKGELDEIKHAFGKLRSEVVSATIHQKKAAINEKGRKEHMNPDMDLKTVRVEDFDALMFVGGNMHEYKDKGNQELVAQTVLKFLDADKVVGAINNGDEAFGYDRNFKDVRYSNRGDIQLAKYGQHAGMVMHIGEVKYIWQMRDLMYQHMNDAGSIEFQLGPKTLMANGGNGRFLVAITNHYFDSDQLGEIRHQLVDKQRAEMVVGAIYVKNSKPLNGKKEHYRTPDIDFNSVDVKEFDGVIFCGGKNGELFNDKNGAKTARRIIDEFLAANKVVSSVGNGYDVLKHNGYLNECRFEDKNSVQVGTPKGRKGMLMVSNESKYTWSLVQQMISARRK